MLDYNEYNNPAYDKEKIESKSIEWKRKKRIEKLNELKKLKGNGTKI